MTLLVAIVAVAALLVAVSLGARWWTHPDLLTPHNAGGDVGFGPRPLATSRATFGVTFPERDVHGTSVTFRSAPVVEFAENTAHAGVTVSICRYRPKTAENTGIGAVNGSGRHYCGSIEPIVDGTHFTFPGVDSIIATIPRPPLAALWSRVSTSTTRWVPLAGIAAATTTSACAS
jgi:hypothetical protein